VHQILVHITTETHSHAGHARHADIIREFIDGAAGFRPDALNIADRMPSGGLSTGRRSRPLLR
jgi:hypothetical protein